jgi:hypothetical protein
VNDTATTRVSDDPDWFLDDPELVIAIVHWAMSRGAIITRSWFGLPQGLPDPGMNLTGIPPEPGGELRGLTRMQASIALRRLGWPYPGEIAAVLSAARENGQHLTARHLVSFHGDDQAGGYDITPRSEVTHFASAADGCGGSCPCHGMSLSGICGTCCDGAGPPDASANDQRGTRPAGIRGEFYAALEKHAAGQDGTYLIQKSPAGTVAGQYEARWLREIRDIAGEVAVPDAQAGGRIRALLYPPHMHEDDGTVEGCAGCFPPGEVIGVTLASPEVPEIREVLDEAVTGTGPPPARQDGHELDWLLSVIPVVDQCLDDLAPEVFRRDDDASRIANRYRRFAAGPVSEAAEAIDALNGMTGGNPRKGVTHTRADLLGEAADTAFSALLAIQSQTKDIRETWTFFIGAAAKAYSRVPDENRAGGASRGRTD